MTTYGNTQNAIVSKLKERTNEQLVSDAKVARLNKSDATQRLICALCLDVLATRMDEAEFEAIYESIYGNDDVFSLQA